MTALKPIESRKVLGVPSEKYPVNKVCAHPECTEPAQGVHHIFPRSLTKSTSYFVSVDGAEPIPHAVGLCGSGTTGHHGDLEEHRAWVKLEDDVYVWYDRAPTEGLVNFEEWVKRGALNPQPGSQDGKTKRRKPKARSTEDKRETETFTIRAPKGEPNMLPETVGYAQEAYAKAAELDRDAYPYETVLACVLEFIENHPVKP